MLRQEYSGEDDLKIYLEKSRNERLLHRCGLSNFLQGASDRLVLYLPRANETEA